MISVITTTKESPFVIIPSSTSKSVTISLHPLVIMNISEHWTRVRAQMNKTTQGI
jgi:COP9 signalosome complex subunit 6